MISPKINRDPRSYFQAFRSFLVHFLETVKILLSKQQKAVTHFLGSTISLLYGLLGLYIRHPPLPKMLEMFYALELENEGNLLLFSPSSFFELFVVSFVQKNVYIGHTVLALTLDLQVFR